MSVLTRIKIAAVALVLSGCVAGARTTTFGGGAVASSPPPLPSGAIVPMWDHYCAALGGGTGGEQAFVELLDSASSQGWEMVGVSRGEFVLYVCFKRPRPTYAPPPPPAPAPAPAS